ncbi:E3 ubiquitin ligase PARAQUAT TOLERANCE 3 [Linum perenne]
MSMITVWYKFVSGRDFHKIRMPGPYTTVADLKSEIYHAKFKAKKEYTNPTGKNDNRRRYYSIWNGCCLGTDHDLLIIDPKTNTPYVDDNALILNQAAVLLRRVPGDRRRRPLDTEPIVPRPQEETDSDGDSTSVTAENSVSISEEIDLHDFGEDVFGVQKKSNPAADEEEQMKIKELVNTPALGIWIPANGGGWNSRKRNQPCSASDSLPPPPDYYVCHRCGIKGHYIQHCPTNGDSNYDHGKRMRPTVTLNPAAECEFNKLMEGISSSSSSNSETTTSIDTSSSSSYSAVVPAELHSPLCRSVMREAVFAKRCCFRSFCNGCIREHVKKSKACVCGAAAANVDAKDDDFVANVTVRKMINSFSQRKSYSSCSSSVGSNSCSAVVITM